MNILILGSGGREHALAWKIAQSPLLDRLYIAPGNAGTMRHGTNLPVSVKDFPAIGKAVLTHHIDMVLVGPEDPLVNGIHDYFLASGQLRHIPVIGPVASAARLEGSKDFAKQFMNRYNIPTARHRTFTPETLTDGIAFLKTLKPPFVLKADGLAAGKGVIICHTLGEAREELSLLLTHQRFGSASAKVVIEEYLKGIELSLPTEIPIFYYLKPRITRKSARVIPDLTPEEWALFLQFLLLTMISGKKSSAGSLNPLSPG